MTQHLGGNKMANKKIGKYVVTKRESELSAVDGATIQGSLAGITNLSTSGTNTFSSATTITGNTNFRKKVSVLTDLGGSGGAIRSALTLADSGTTFLVPALTGGVHTLALPANTAANVGFHCTFTMIGTAGEIFKVQTAAGADKIITAEPDGDGDFTINASADEFHFTAAAVVGASFKITCISTTDAIAFVVSNVVSGLAAGTGEHVAA